MICFWLGGRGGGGDEKKIVSAGGGGPCGKKLHARGGGHTVS